MIVRGPQPLGATKALQFFIAGRLAGLLRGRMVGFDHLMDGRFTKVIQALGTDDLASWPDQER